MGLWEFHSLEEKLENIGVQVMRNRVEGITAATDKIQLIGIDDPAKVKESHAERAITEKISAIQ